MSSLDGNKDSCVRSKYGPCDLSIRVGTYYLDFFMTCQACPEQYDVFIEDKQVGYVRLRWGALRAAYPDVGAEYGYTHVFPDLFKGCFANDKERDFYLEQVAKYLYNRFIQSEKA